MKYRRTKRADLFSTGEREWSNQEGFFIPFEASVWLLNVLWLASFSRIWSAWVFEKKASSGASCDASRARAGISDEDNLRFVEQSHPQNLWFCRVCWLVEQIPSHIWQLVTITSSAGHLAGLLDWSFSLRSFLCCSSCCLRKLGSIQKWIPWEWCPYYRQRWDSDCENTPAWGLYNLVEDLWHYLEKLKLRSGCRAKRIWEETSVVKYMECLPCMFIISTVPRWTFVRLAGPAQGLHCLSFACPVTQHKLMFIKYRGLE